LRFQKGAKKASLLLVSLDEWEICPWVILTVFDREIPPGSEKSEPLTDFPVLTLVYLVLLGWNVRAFRTLTLQEYLLSEYQSMTLPRQ
jgi:hypothetical protein